MSSWHPLTIWTSLSRIPVVLSLFDHLSDSKWQFWIVNKRIYFRPFAGTFSRSITCKTPSFVIEQLINWCYEVKNSPNWWFLYNRNKRHRKSIINYLWFLSWKDLQIGVQSLVVKKHSSNEETYRLFIYYIRNNFSGMLWTIDTSNLS